MTIDIDVQIKDGSTDITNYVISYNRVHDLCTGKGTLDLVVDPNYTSLQQGNLVTLTENGNKIGEFFVGTAQKDVTSGYSYSCQDGSKWVEQYFIPVMRSTQGGSSRYWIGLILGEAKVSYNFTTASNGYFLPDEDQIGLETAYEVVMKLCQQSGWYFYFDANGVCQIGDLDTNWHNPSLTIATSDNKMISEELVIEDSQLRNKVVVWGGAIDFSDSQIYASMTVTTPWDRDAKDKRTIVYSNNHIRDFGTAWRMGKRLLDEYSKTVSLKTYILAGYVDATVGDVIYCDTIIYDGVGRVSIVQSSVTSDRGFRTTLVIDKRCPRIFSYWSSSSEYVYAGTEGNGVWRKPFDTNSWTNYSTGLTNLIIHDLKISSGFFVCTADGGLAFTRKIIDSAWTPFLPEGFVDEDTETEYVYSDLITSGVGLDRNTNTCYIGYYHPVDKRAWVVELFPDKTYSILQIITDTEEAESIYEYILYDTDHNSVNILLSAFTEVEDDPFYALVRVIYDATGGVAINGAIAENKAYLNALPFLDDTSSAMTLTGTIGSVERLNSGPMISEEYGKAWFTEKSRILEIDHDTGSTASYIFTSNLPGVYSSSRVASYRSGDSTFEILGDHGSASNYPRVAHSQLNTVTGVVTQKWQAPTEADLYNFQYTVAIHDNIIFYGWRTTAGQLKLAYYNISSEVGATYSADLPYDKSWMGSFSTNMTEIAFDNNYAIISGASLVRKDDISSEGFVGTVATIAIPLAGGEGTGTSTEVFVSAVDYPITANNGIAWIKYIAVDKLEDTAYALVQFGQNETRGGPTVWLNQKSIIINMRDGSTINEIYDFETSDVGYTSASNYSVYRNWSTATLFNFLPLITRSGVPTVLFRNTFSSVNYSYNPKENSESTWAGGLSTHNGYAHMTDDYDFTVFENAKTRSVPAGGVTKTFTGITAGYDEAFVSSGRLFTWSYGTKPATIRMYSSDISHIPDSLPPASGDLIPWPVAITSTPTVSGVGYTFDRIRRFDQEGLQIEVSRESPIVYFGGDPTEEEGGAMYFSTSATESGRIFQMPMAADWIPLHRLGYIPDIRVVDLVGAQSTTDGLYIYDWTDYQRSIIAAQRDDDLDDSSWMFFHDAFSISNFWKSFKSLSGDMHRMETTNYFVDPWVFTSISGAPSQFYQMESGSVDFVEHSVNLPSSNILVIRADDRI